MSEQTHSPQSLIGEINAIRDCFARGDLAAMPSLLELHDEHLRDYCRSPQASQNSAQLRELQAMQHEMIELMRARQQQLLELMRAQRQHTRVARAYAHAGLIR